MPNDQKNLLVICGANASGKTRLAVALALRLNGEIISADSRQVYRGLDIGAGKDLEEYHTPSGTVPCHLIDIADPGDVYTLFHYQRDCYKVINDILGRGKTPIMAGGTGLFIEAVIRNYTIPNVPENRPLRELLMKKEKSDLIRQLQEADTALFESTDKTSKKRVVRSLEVAEHARRHPVQSPAQDMPDIRPLVFCITWPRQALIERINARLAERLDKGMVAEVRKLLDSGVSCQRLVYLGMEYKHIARYLTGEVSYDAMVRELAGDIHKLAKRQMTYFRGMEKRGTPVHWIEQGCLEHVLDVIDRDWRK